jgi:hypothetical protein
MNIVVLVPHRDIAPNLRNMSRNLFGAAFYGAYSFPNVIPLFTTEQPETKSNLKIIAQKIREGSLLLSERGKFESTTLSYIEFPFYAQNLFLYGIEFQNPIPQVDNANHTFNKMILNAALCTHNDIENLQKITHEKITFRAAALANMTYTHLEIGDNNYSFKWEIGELVWLANPGNRS